MSEQISATGFNSFYRIELTPLVHFMIRLGASQPEAEDAAQEAMKTALLRWADIENPKAYVRRAAKRAFYRARNRDRDRPAREIEASRPHVKCSPVVIFDEETQYVLDALRSLPRAQREVMAWTVDGYEPAEIAGIVGKNPATVRTNLRHARKALLAKLRPDDDPIGEEESDGP